jgi:uncharacterized protein DUF6387
MDNEKLKQFSPPGFDLSKYKPASDMDLYSWWCNLLMRSLHNHSEESINHNIKVGAVSMDVTDQELLDHYLKQKRNGGSDVAEIPAIAVVKNISMLDVMMCVDDIEYSDNHEEIRQLYHSYMNDEGGREKAKRIRQIRPYYFDEENMEYWLNVDLSCSDREVKQAFNFWLKKAREELSPNAKPMRRRSKKINDFNEVTLRGWYINKVLPYIDLVSWNNFKGNKPTSAVLGQIICPEQNNPAGTIDDTIKPLAGQLKSRRMDQRIMTALYEMNRQKIDELSS